MKTQKGRLIKDFICLTLIVTMALGMPMCHLEGVLVKEDLVYADEVKETPCPDNQVEDENTEEIKMTEEPTILEEKEELRESDKKYFEMSDGSTKVCIYPQSVHYVKDGKYEEIDNSLELVETTEIETSAPTESVSVSEEPEEIMDTELPDDRLNFTEEPELFEEETITKEPVEILDEEETQTPEAIDSINNDEIDIEEVTCNDDVVQTDDDIVEATENINTSLPTIEPEETEMLDETEVPEETEEAKNNRDKKNKDKSKDESKTNSKEKSKDLEKDKAAKAREKDEKSRIKGNHYKNKSNSFEVGLPEDYSTDYTEFSDENGYVRFKLLGAEKSKIKNEDGKKEKKGDKTVVENVNSKVSYKGLKKHVDIEYDIAGDMLKETIVLNKKTKDDFIFEIITSSEDVRLNEDGSVDFFTENEEKLYTINAPYMNDALGEYSTSINVSLEEKEDSFLLTYSPDEEWLFDKKREYPVRIDPTMVKSMVVQNVTDTYVSSVQNKNAPSIWGKTDVMVVGKRPETTDTSEVKCRGMLRFDIPTEISPNDCILNAQLHFVHYTGGGTSISGTQIDVHELTGDFSETSTWGLNSVSYNTTPVEYCYVNTSRKVEGSNYYSYDSYDITELVNGWHSGKPNYGLMLKLHNEDEAISSRKEVYYFTQDSFYYKDVSRYIEITYRNTEGIEDYWAYNTHSIGRAGESYVNLYNGNLVYVHPDVSNDTLINGFTLSHVYNKSATDENNGDMNFFGKGFNLNLRQNVYPVSIP